MNIADIDVTYVGHYGTDLTVVNAARVSFHKVADEIKAGDEKLISYLAKHKHFSPFNHAFISVRVKAPIIVARQLVKHKFMPWNEVSRRYVDDEPEFYHPAYLRKRGENVKQGSSEDKLCDHIGVQTIAVQEGLRAYNVILEYGGCPEQARMYLPQNTMTEWIWSGTLGAFCDMLRLRLDAHTQYETRIVANKVFNIISPLFPVSVAALLEKHE